jgi:hypothetical protein
LVFKSMKIECETHPILRILKNIDFIKFFNLQDLNTFDLNLDLAKLPEFNNFNTNLFNNYWIVLISGLYLDICDFQSN